MKNVEQVLKENMCAGCGLCSDSQQNMYFDHKGYLRPKSPIDDELSKACPGIGLAQKGTKKYNEIWGEVLACKIGFASTDLIRKKGSSGGVITALVKFCLESKLVDGVIQVGKSESSPIENAVYVLSDIEGVVNNAGSRYSPSAPLSEIRNLLGNGKRYAFVGKPCDVAALRQLILKERSIGEQFPFLFSFMCAGIPSRDGTLKVLDSLSVRPDQLVDFKYRGDGWPGLTKATLSDGEVRSMTYNESWGKILNRFLQPRCKVCVDGTGEFADIVCADAWHASENGYPSFDEQDGRSLILVRTGAGKELLQEAISIGALDGVEDFPLSEIKTIQPYQHQRKASILSRKLALGLLGQKSPIYKGFSLDKAFFSIPLKLQIKFFVGTIIRRLKGRF